MYSGKREPTIRGGEIHNSAISRVQYLERVSDMLLRKAGNTWRNLDDKDIHIYGCENFVPPLDLYTYLPFWILKEIISPTHWNFEGKIRS